MMVRWLRLLDRPWLAPDCWRDISARDVARHRLDVEDVGNSDCCSRRNSSASAIQRSFDFRAKTVRYLTLAAIGARGAVLPQFVTSRRYIIYFVKIFLRKNSLGTVDALTRAGAEY
jgi:hypothetical protein